MLMALGEAPFPIAIDPQRSETRGCDDILLGADGKPRPRHTIPHPHFRSRHRRSHQHTLFDEFAELPTIDYARDARLDDATAYAAGGRKERPEGFYN